MTTSPATPDQRPPFDDSFAPAGGPPTAVSAEDAAAVAEGWADPSLYRLAMAELGLLVASENDIPPTDTRGGGFAARPEYAAPVSSK